MSLIKKILSYFFHHQLSGEMVDRVHQRLAQAGDEREKEEALQEIWDEIGFPSADKRSETAFNQLQNTLTLKSRFSIRIGLRIAASWLIPILSVGLSFYFYQNAKDVKALDFREQFVPSGKREQITLPDGSEVWLNSETLLLYPSDFGGSKREIYLVGEGYFKIKRCPEQPFIVHTKAMKAEVLGTEFNLSAYSDQGKITTTLKEGSLKILPADPFVAPCLLQPNEQLVYIPSEKKISVRRVVATDYADWREGGLLFNNDSFEYILRSLERVYPIKVHLRTSAYHGNRLTIHFNKNESLENILMLIKEMIPGLEYQVKEDEVYID